MVHLASTSASILHVYRIDESKRLLALASASELAQHPIRNGHSTANIGLHAGCR